MNTDSKIKAIDRNSKAHNCKICLYHSEEAYFLDVQNVQNQSFLSFKIRLQLQSTNKSVLYSFKSSPYLVI